MLLDWFPFRWESLRVQGRVFPRAAMFVLGRLPSLGLEGWFQFDLGAPTSVLYGAALPDAARAQAEAQRLPETARFNGQDVPLLDLPLHLGSWALTRVVYLPDFGDPDETPPDGRPVLGTVGGDFARGHILVLDFPRQRLTRLDALPPAWDASIPWTPLRLSPHGHVLLQVTLDDQPRWVMYDSGSSLFALLTDPDQWRGLTTGEVTERFPITAWGDLVQVQGGPIHRRFALGGVPLDVPKAHFVENEAWKGFLAQLGLVGIMGNAPFQAHILVLDFPRSRAGLLAHARLP